ncbi:hypothetical protein BYT27DRAFT_6334845 [Phlegmacium glaucopus]|nr:hypothetical protein BYT27DRAFT_6334845 [Phlegmacium glaucopus]
MDFCDSATGDGCARSFPNKSSPGLCEKCAKLASLTEGSSEYDQWKNFKQCESCGIAWKNLDSSKCGRCSNMKPPPPPVIEPSTQSLVRTAVETSRAARSHAMDARLTKQPIASQQLHTTAGLIAAKSNTTAGDNTVFITAQCHIKTTSAKDQRNTDPGCGQWGKPWPKDIRKITTCLIGLTRLIAADFGLNLIWALIWAYFGCFV